MLVVNRFRVTDESQFLEQANAALRVLAERDGFVSGRLGRAADDPTRWCLVTEWSSVGAYRRALSAYDVKMYATPLLARSEDEPSAFEVLLESDGDTIRHGSSDRATGA